MVMRQSFVIVLLLLLMSGCAEFHDYSYRTVNRMRSKEAWTQIRKEHPDDKFSDHYVDGWKEGYCPVCGSRAGMAELSGDEGKRRLSCSACFFQWPYPRIQCPYCGNADPETLSYFTAGDGPTRVGVCRKCSRYLKTRDARLGNADVPMEAEDLVTLHLDLLAGKEGFERGK